MKRMRSKLHGFCHANDGNEEAYLRKLGWIEENEKFPGEEVKTVAAPLDAAEAEKTTAKRKTKTEE